MKLPTSTGFQRSLLAVSAALVATGLCIARGHVRINLADASTYASSLQHRCGLLMVACIAWAVCEVGLYFLPAIQSQFVKP